MCELVDVEPHFCHRYCKFIDIAQKFCASKREAELLSPVRAPGPVGNEFVPKGDRRSFCAHTLRFDGLHQPRSLPARWRARRVSTACPPHDLLSCRFGRFARAPQSQPGQSGKQACAPYIPAHKRERKKQNKMTDRRRASEKSARRRGRRATGTPEMHCGLSLR